MYRLHSQALECKFSSGQMFPLRDHKPRGGIAGGRVTLCFTVPGIALLLSKATAPRTSVIWKGLLLNELWEQVDTPGFVTINLWKLKGTHWIILLICLLFTYKGPCHFFLVDDSLLQKILRIGSRLRSRGRRWIRSGRTGQTQAREKYMGSWLIRNENFPEKEESLWKRIPWLYACTCL